MADDLLRPHVPSPRGLPPKKLVVTLFATLCLVVLAIAFFTSSPAEPVTGDGIARQNASRLTEQDRTTIGAAAAHVREAAERSGLPAQFRLRPPEPAASSTPLPPGMPLPAGAMAPAAAASRVAPAQPERDPGEVARQVEALNSRMAILDVDDGVKAVPSAAAASRASASGAGPAPEAPRPASPTDPAAQAMAAVLAAEEPRPAPAPLSPERRFRADLADVRTQAALRPQAAESRFLVMEGSVIPAALLRDIVSDLPGVMSAVVSQDVYDSISSRHLLICKGTRLVGQYSSDVVQGQSRLLFAFTRLILPDGSSFDLGGFDGSDMAGRAGVGGEVDNHFLRIYGSALLTGLLADRVTRPAAVPRGDLAQPSATGQVMMDAARAMLQRQQRIAPTITIPRGTRIHVEVRRDLAFPAPAAGRCT